MRFLCLVSIVFAVGCSSSESSSPSSTPGTDASAQHDAVELDASGFDSTSSDVGASCFPDQDVQGALVLSRPKGSWLDVLVGVSKSVVIVKERDSDGSTRFLVIPRNGSDCPIELPLPDGMTSINDFVPLTDGGAYFGLGASDIRSDAIFLQSIPQGPLVRFAPTDGIGYFYEVFGNDAFLFALQNNEVHQFDKAGQSTKLIDITPATIGSVTPRYFRTLGARLLAYRSADFPEALGWPLGDPLPQAHRVLEHAHPFSIVDIEGEEVYFVLFPKTGERSLRKTAIGSSLSFGGGSDTEIRIGVTAAIRVGSDFVVTESSAGGTRLRRVSESGTVTDLSEVPVIGCPWLEEHAAICRDAENRWLQVPF